MMRVFVCGSLTWRDPDAIRKVIESLPDGSVVIHGACPSGADLFADVFARRRGLRVIRFPADWRMGKQAGPRRNRRMLAEGRPDVVYAFRARGESRGTDGMIRLAKAAGVPVHVIQER